MNSCHRWGAARNLRRIPSAAVLVAGAFVAGCGDPPDRPARPPKFVIFPEGVLPIWDSNPDRVVVTVTMDVSELVRPVDPSIVERRRREGEAIRAKTPRLLRQIPRDVFWLELPTQSMEDLVARLLQGPACSDEIKGCAVEPVGKFRLRIVGKGSCVGEAVRCVLREMRRRQEYESDVPTWILDSSP